ncbi:hypothetical protein LCGC14_1614270 [marine sediment metagenome]|uniref:Uncharacterized protein n=1 Tax=marine sediment metagenome TaxID=412755 RepID=A0A0F9IU68_9ZZZZ
MSASSATLANLRDRVEALLVDTSNVIWGTSLLDEAIAQALAEYSEQRPLKSVATLALTSILSTNKREIDISSLTALVLVEALWAPYTTADDDPKERGFEHWLEDETLYLAMGDALETSESARIFYDKHHTINGLDSEATTTYRAGDDSIIVLGGVAYALLARGNDLTEQVTLSADTVDQLRDLSDDFFKEFRRRLGVVVASEPRR